MTWLGVECGSKEGKQTIAKALNVPASQYPSWVIRMFLAGWALRRSCAPAELFLPKGKLNSKRRKQKKSGISWSENRVGTTLNTRSWHEGSNPFELLMVETLENEEAPELE